MRTAQSIQLNEPHKKKFNKEILVRIKPKLERYIFEQKYGFMKIKGSANAMYIMKNICGQVIERQKKNFLCFIDYEKAFDKVQQLFNLLADRHLRL